MSAYDELERQLRGSVAGQAARRGGWLPPRSWSWSWSRGLSGVTIAISTAVTLGIAVFAVVALHHGRPTPSAPISKPRPVRHHFVKPPTAGPIPRNVDDGVVAAAFNAGWRADPTCRPGTGRAAHTRTTSGRPSTAILAALPVLARPATRADRVPRGFFQRQILFLRADVFVHYARRVRVAEGSTFYLVPAAGLGARPLSEAAAERCYRALTSALRAELSSVPANERAATRRYGELNFADAQYNLETSHTYQGVSLIGIQTDGGGSGSGYESAAAIRRGGDLGGGGGGKPPTPIVMDGIVPGGVATVTLHFPASRHRGRRLPPLNATGHVINDVFVIRIPSLFERGGWPTTAVWRSSSGKVIKTVNERPFHP